MLQCPYEKRAEEAERQLEASQRREAALREDLHEAVEVMRYDAPPCPEGPNCDHCQRFSAFIKKHTTKDGVTQPFARAALAEEDHGQ